MKIQVYISALIIAISVPGSIGQASKTCQDSTSAFKRRRCERINPKQCSKEWIADLCPQTCGRCPSRRSTCTDSIATFPFRGQRFTTCTAVAKFKMPCKNRDWIRDLCPRSCGVCTPDEEDEFAGSVERNIFTTSPKQPLHARVKLFGPSSVEAYTDCEELESDLFNVVSLLTNEAINRNVDSKGKQYRGSCCDEVVALASPSIEFDNDSIDSFGTNNQVENVDEADVVKSTEFHVYAAYGNKLIVWDAKTLAKLADITMPLEEIDERELSSVISPQSNIRGLLLYSDNLLVIIQRYNWNYQDPISERSIIQGNGQIELRLYDVSDPSEPILTAEDTLEGDYVDARMIESKAHIVTTARVDTYWQLTRFFSRYESMYESMNDEQYVAAASSYAIDKVIPSFVERLSKELNTGEQCTDLLKVSIFQSINGAASTQKTFVNPVVNMNGLGTITTVDLMGVHSETRLTSKGLSTMLPNSYNTVVYASSDRIVLATRGYELLSNDMGSNEKTFLQVMSLGDIETGAAGHSATQAPGYLLNQYAIDIWDGHLRLATTTRTKWGCIPTNETESLDETTRFIFPRCDRVVLEDSNNFIHVFQLSDSNDNDAMANQVGYLEGLGKPGERIEAVRFMGDKAFVVTFLRTDPFYTINMRNHSLPEKVGELEITGFSNYLHPFDSAGNFLLGVGQDADDTGRTSGLQISLFDVSNFSHPTLVNRFKIENGRNEYSSSAAQYEPKAFRLLSVSETSKILIIPTSVRAYLNPERSFDGFQIFDVSTDKISFSFNISHVDPKQMSTYCWYNAYLSPRSLVHDGIVTTMKGHTAVAHDLFNKTKVNELNMDTGNNVCARGGYWVF
jgi:uncharacterized secreted protein with C-terminal beta-propeller domain